MSRFFSHWCLHSGRRDVAPSSYLPKIRNNLMLCHTCLYSSETERCYDEGLMKIGFLEAEENVILNIISNEKYEYTIIRFKYMKSWSNSTLEPLCWMIIGIKPNFHGYVPKNRSQADYLEPFNLNLGCDLSLELYYSVVIMCFYTEKRDQASSASWRRRQRVLGWPNQFCIIFSCIKNRDC